MIENHIEEEDERALQRVGDGEDVREGHTVHEDVDEAGDPREPRDERDGERRL